MINPFLKEKLPDVTRILKDNKVKRAYVFGSVCTEKFNTNSDIDFLISFEDGLDPIEYGDNYFKILYALRDLLKRDIDLVTEITLKNPYFINVLNRTKTLLYD